MKQTFELNIKGKQFKIDTEPTGNPNEQRANCPVCNPPDEGKHFYVNTEKKTYFCHKCNEGGSFGQSKKSKAQLELKKTYTYQDEKYNVTHLIGRFEDPEGKKTFKVASFDEKGQLHWGQGENTISLYSLPNVLSSKTTVFIVEGEKCVDKMTEIGLTATTNPFGAGKWKARFNAYLKSRNIVILPDNDRVGRKHAEDIARNLKSYAKTIKVVELPGLKGKEDIYDWVEQGHTKEELLALVDQAPLAYEPIDISKFEPMTCDDLNKILGLTVKKDEENKLLTFLCMLSAFTDDCQFNISFNAPSSTGKSYIPLEIDKLFPKEDVLELAYSSPTAFFHDRGEWDEDAKATTIDLSRKILIFIDQPHNELLERLRPMLSHDRKEIMSKITDRNKRGSNRTKNILLKGYPSVIFCTAKLKIDEQEATRFLLLSPNTDQEKIREAVNLAIFKECNAKAYNEWLESNPDRQLLKTMYVFRPFWTNMLKASLYFGAGLRHC